MIKYFNDEMTNDERIQAWDVNRKLLEEVKKVEMEQRKHLSALLFPAPKSGTNKFELGYGWTLQLVAGEETKLDSSIYKLIQADLPDSVKDKCITWEPKMDVRSYKKLTEVERERLDDAIVTKPKSPVLKLVPPKEPK